MHCVSNIGFVILKVEGHDVLGSYSAKELGTRSPLERLS